MATLRGLAGGNQRLDGTAFAQLDRLGHRGRIILQRLPPLCSAARQRSTPLIPRGVFFGLGHAVRSLEQLQTGPARTPNSSERRRGTRPAGPPLCKCLCAAIFWSWPQVLFFGLG